MKKYKDIYGNKLKVGDKINFIWSIVGEVREVDGVMGLYDTQFNNFFNLRAISNSNQFIVVKVNKELPQKQLEKRVKKLNNWIN